MVRGSASGRHSYCLRCWANQCERRPQPRSRHWRGSCRLDLRPLDIATAELAVALAASYRLHAADAVHLATAVQAGADRFLTNNSRDFSKDVAEVAVTYLQDLPDKR